MSIVRCLALMASAAISLLAACGGEVPPGGEPQAVEGALALKTIRAFSLGGQPEVAARTGIFGDVSDEVFAGQIAVTALVPDAAQPRFPIVMLPGFALGATIYLETPDGREGWALNAVRRGHPVYLVEPAHSARAGFNPHPYTAAQLGEATDSPVLFTWGRRHAWRRWGLGPAYAEPFANSRFPVAHYDNLIRAYSAVDVGRLEGEAMIAYQLGANVNGLLRLLEQVGPAVLLVHSASGVIGFEVARQRPDAVLSVVNVEPVGCPTADVGALDGIAVLSMFGDHMEVRQQMPVRRSECQQTIDYLASHGTPAEMFDLPVMGIEGNSHLPMSENNSAELMDRVLTWLYAKLSAEQ